jgi:tRNA A-37 threonylcarbamoyl transferase component Bud32
MTVVDDIRAFLVGAGLGDATEPLTLEPLLGGVASDIWRVRFGSRTLCVKRALAQLRVPRKWEAPIERSSHEWAWLVAASRIIPGSTPELYAHDPGAGLIAMEYLPPEDFPNWKVLLRDGTISLPVATAVGERLGALHAATADREDYAQKFATDDTFYALRLKPYFVDCAEVHPKLASALDEITRVTASTKRVLVHGDVSPKNILVGAGGPKFIDAECAWFGDPAFDLAFVLNHLLLKAVWRPAYTREFRAAFEALATAYRSKVIWENVAVLERRCARLLPALALARIDGTSPVEYLAEDQRESVRALASALIREQCTRLDDVAEAWTALRR